MGVIIKNLQDFFATCLTTAHKKLNCFFPGLPKPVGLRAGMSRMVTWAKETGKYFEPVKFDAVEVMRKLPSSWKTDGLKEVPAFEHNENDNVIEAELLTRK